MSGVVVPSRSQEPAAVTGLQCRNGVAVLALAGRLDPDCLGVCRSALSQVLAMRPHVVILDLAGITGGETATAVLRLMRNHAARRGARVWLACAPEPLLSALHRVETLSEFGLLPTRDAMMAVLAHPPARQPR